MTTELPEEPQSRKELYLADIAGEDVTLPEEPKSREEQYLAYIAENGGGGGGGGTNNFNQLTNRPSYNNAKMTGSTNIPKVPTKTSELSNDSGYITSSSLPTVNDGTLTIKQNNVSKGTFTANDSDNVEIELSDTTYSNFTGTDGTAAGTAGLVPAPATTDAGKFLSASGLWAAVSAGSGGVKELTTSDYNYPTDNPSSVALWLLEPGIYYRDPTSASGNFTVRASTTSAFVAADGQSRNYYIVMPSNNSSNVSIYVFGNGNIANSVARLLHFYSVTKSNGVEVITNYALTGSMVEDSLTSSSSVKALSANQGKVLKDLVDSLAIRGAGAPTTSTVGAVGTLYEDTTNGKLYQCTAIVPGTAPDPDTYTWSEVGAGGGGPTVVQTTGTSTTDVMSQNATTGLIYKDPGTNSKVCIGGASNACEQAIAIGPSAYAGEGSSSGTQSIALGPTSNTYGGAKAVAIGASTRARNTEAVAIGYYANGQTDTGQYSIAIGSGSKAEKWGSVAIGYSSDSASGVAGVAIGPQAITTGKSAVAIGSGAYADTQGQFDISAGSNNEGFNNSNYRKITGVYDGQSAHDAATVGQITPTTDSSAPTTSTAGRLGEIRIDTTDNSAYMCVVSDSVTPTYTWKKVTA